MGFNSVYQSLTEIFPQIDSRLLRAVALEHPLDADEAAAVVLSDIVPSLPSNSPHYFTPPWYMSSDSMSKREVERGLEDVGSRSRAPLVAPGSKSSASSSWGTTPRLFGLDLNTSASSSKSSSDRIKLKKLPLYGSKSSASSSSETPRLVVGRSHNTDASSTKFFSNWNKQTNLPQRTGRGVCHEDVETGSKFSPFSSSGTIPAAVSRGTDAYTTFVFNRNELTNFPQHVGRGVCHKYVASEPLGKAPGKEHGNFDFFGKCSDVPSKATIGLHVPEDDLASVVSAVPQDNVKFGSDFWQDLDHMTWNQEDSITSIGSENAVPKLVDLIPGDNVASVQQDSCFEVGTGSTNVVDKTSKGSLASENGDTGLGIGSTNVVDQTSNGSLASDNGDSELGTGSTIVVDKPSNDSLASENGDTELGTVSANVVDKTSKDSSASEDGDTESSAALISSTQGCSVDHLEEIIEEAKSNKKTLITVMDLVMNLMKEVELQENDVEKSKVEAAKGGLDTLEKVEELKKMLEHAKEANDMHAGEVYGEKSILATEVRELENRLLNLSEERNKSLSVLDEMRETLEIRLAAALIMKKAAEQEKKEKEDAAIKALAEQEAVMEKVVEESKLLKQEAEENSKLREFLMDRGQIVDSLQGEISVICQDVKLLKEKFDNRVSLTKSISSSQTSSYALFMRSLVLCNPTEQFNEVPETSNNNKIPETALNETSSNNKIPEASVVNDEEKKDDHRELLEDGWEWDMIN